MCFTFKKNNKQTKKPVNHSLQDDANAGIRSLQTSIEIKLCQSTVFSNPLIFLKQDDFKTTQTDERKDSKDCIEISLVKKYRFLF